MIEGGKKKKKKYILIYMPSHPNSNRHGYIREHRLVMESMIGRLLDQKEVVHHINGNSMDNSPENLELYSSNGEHLAVDLKGRCPRWSEEGKKRIHESVTRPRPQMRKTSQNQKVKDDQK